MRKFIFFIIGLICLGWIVSCPSTWEDINNPSNEICVANQSDFDKDATARVIDTVYIDTVKEGDEVYTYQSQAELNEIHIRLRKKYGDSIEMGVQKLLKTFPRYKNAFNKEQTVWKNYQKAVQSVAECEYHGSSTPMFIDDVISQGIGLRAESILGLLRHANGEDVSFSKTVFTSKMIDDAYVAYIRAVGEDEYIDNKDEYQEQCKHSTEYR